MATFLRHRSFELIARFAALTVQRHPCARTVSGYSEPINASKVLKATKASSVLYTAATGRLAFAGIRGIGKAELDRVKDLALGVQPQRITGLFRTSLGCDIALVRPLSASREAVSDAAPGSCRRRR